MKLNYIKNIIIIFLALLSVQLLGQSGNNSEEWFVDFITNYGLENKESKANLIKYDFSDLFLKTSSNKVYGIIGDSMQRLQVKWISIKKDVNNPENYLVKGKTKVKSNICEFSGFLKIKTIRLYEQGKYDMPYDCKINPEKIGVLFCDYELTENKSEKHTGVFKGISATDFYIFNDSLFYNELRTGADDMTNNQFVGTWTSFNNGVPKICNWGDFRVPNVRDFDCGAAEFMPCEEYASKGWLVFMIAHGANSERMNIKEAQMAENENW